MEKQKLISVCTGILALVGFIVWIVFSENKIETPAVTIAFLDVGQGDAVFIETPTGNQILIDGGVDSGVLSELGRVMRPGDHSIDIVIATHPDADHIAGLVEVLKRYQVDTFIDSGAESKTAVYAALYDEVINIPYSVAVSIGDRISSDDGVVLDILAPYGIDTGKDTNARSVVTRLSYGNLSVMLTGDAPKEVEQDLVRWYGNQLESEILKAGHHGSKTSTDQKFLTALQPMYSVISASANNRYGHPHKEVLDLLEKAGVSILGTYNEGTIIFESDGVHLWKK